MKRRASRGADGRADLVDVVGVWRRHGLKASSCGQYCQWVRRYVADCTRRGVDAVGTLDFETARDFARRYVRRRGIASSGAMQLARLALHAWAWALRVLGDTVPEWRAPARRPRPVCPALRGFVAHRRSVCGLSDARSEMEVTHLEEWIRFLGARGRSLRAISLRDADAFLARLGRRFSPATVANFAASIRAFLRFLHTTGRLRFDLASSIQTPVRRRQDLPRALPWREVRRLVGSVERASRLGRRDHALLLVMSVYGLGAAEVTGIRLDDIDWSARTLVIRRPKTGVTIHLPLLDPVARTLADYIRRARPPDGDRREVFLRKVLPPAPLSSSAIRHIVRIRARRAGIRAAMLGGHVLRHSHACRQIELGAPPKVIGDILGHRDPETTSVYARVAVRQLRGLALPVPR